MGLTRFHYRNPGDYKMTKKTKNTEKTKEDLEKIIIGLEDKKRIKNLRITEDLFDLDKLEEIIDYYKSLIKTEKEIK